MAGVRFPLAARDRILLHLSEFGSVRAEEAEFPPPLTQDGIASRTGLGRAHVALALKAAREEGLVDEVKGRVAGEARRRKVYLLSEPGKGRCRGLVTAVMGAEVEIRRDGTPSKKAKLSEASFALEKKLPLIELALSVREGGILMLDRSGSLVRPAKEEEEAPGEAAGAAPAAVETLQMDDGKAAEKASVSSPAKLWDEPEATSNEQPSPDGPGTPEPETPSQTPRKITGAGPVRTDYREFPSEGAPQGTRASPDIPSGAASQEPPPAAAPPVRPWVRRGQFASLWIGAVVLTFIFIFFGGVLNALDSESELFGFLITYFLVMVTLQWFLLGAKRIPANVRAEVGIYIGGFMALYGSTGAFFEMGKFVGPCLWFTEGLLLLCTGLLLHPQEPTRKFQVAGASVGSFIVYFCLLGLITNEAKGDVRLLSLGTVWFVLGCLLIAARLFPQRTEYSSWLRTAAALSSGILMMTIGAFLAFRGLFAESFVEFLVGAAILFYTAPRKREDWKVGLIGSTAVMCVTVAVTVFVVLLRVAEILQHS